MEGELLPEVRQTVINAAETKARTPGGKLREPARDVSKVWGKSVFGGFIEYYDLAFSLKKHLFINTYFIKSR